KEVATINISEARCRFMIRSVLLHPCIVYGGSTPCSRIHSQGFSVPILVQRAVHDAIDIDVLGKGEQFLKMLSCIRSHCVFRDLVPALLWTTMKDNHTGNTDHDGEHRSHGAPTYRGPNPPRQSGGLRLRIQLT